MFKWARFSSEGYEVSTHGDKRFSALNAKLKSGRTIEQIYQCDIKAYDPGGINWRLGKGKPPKDTSVNLWEEYLKLWIQWGKENPKLMEELKYNASLCNSTLTDKFATTPVNQARALATVLNEINFFEDSENHEHDRNLRTTVEAAVQH